MSPLSIAVIAVSMSIDAFLAAVGRGAGLRQPGFSEAFRTGLVFGGIEMLTPLVGWTVGVTASSYAAGYIAAVDHWIAFGLLALVGGRMVVMGVRRRGAASPRETSGRSLVLVATAIGTSIDALAVGVSLAFLDVDIAVVACAIGLATLCMSTGGMLMGSLISRRFGRVAEIGGGLALIGVGLSILFSHLAGAGAPLAGA